MSFVAAQDQDVVERYEATTTGVGGVLCAAPSKPALAPPQSPSFPVLGPPESVTVSINC